MAFAANPSRHLHPPPIKLPPCHRIRYEKPNKLPAIAGRPVSSSSSSRVPDGLVKKGTSSHGGCPYSSMIMGYARNGHLPEAMRVWEQILYSSSVPTKESVSELMDALARSGHFNMVCQILQQATRKNSGSLSGLYVAAISCFGKAGQFRLMNEAFEELVSLGVKLDSITGDDVIGCYSSYGTLNGMEAVYAVLKRSRHLILERGVRFMSLAYIREGKFFRLGEFVRDVGLGRRDLGNLLWNVLLLSYAVNFKMKSMQREFLGMTRSGFVPDINTFNIRMLAFSRMSLFWDLHLSLQHMEHVGVAPDLVTVGCIVDAYLERRLGRNLGFALKRVSMNDPAEVVTDPMIFEAFGKGDFHSSSEAFMEYSNRKRKNGMWSFRELIAVYLKKHSRREHIFWNY